MALLQDFVDFTSITIAPITTIVAIVIKWYITNVIVDIGTIVKEEPEALSAAIATTVAATIIIATIAILK